MAEEAIENKDIKTKMYFRGKVLKTSLAGALVDIGKEKPAFLHIARIATDEKSAIKKVDKVLNEGQEIDVWVKRLTKDRIELTMFKPLDYEWRDLQADMVVKGKVVKFETFGAFIDIGAERPGLLHVSEMAHEFVKRPQDVIKEGEEIEAKIIAVDRKKKQIKLSMKALIPEPEKETPEPKLETKQTRKNSPRDKKREDEVPSEAEEAIPTAMELALRHAMDKAKNKTPREDAPVKKTKDLSDEQQDILTRTLEQKALTK